MGRWRRQRRSLLPSACYRRRRRLQQCHARCDAQPGDTFVIVVGQGGAFSSASAGGAGRGNTQGGAPGFFNNTFTNRGQGGQASSVFFITNDLLVMKAVAGAGGGGGSGGRGGAAGERGQDSNPAIGGEPGANGSGGIGQSSGNNYNASAISTGISALNQAGGNGGPGTLYSGGGGAGGSSDIGGSGRWRRRRRLLRNNRHQWQRLCSWKHVGRELRRQRRTRRPRLFCGIGWSRSRVMDFCQSACANPAEPGASWPPGRPCSIPRI